MARILLVDDERQLRHVVGAFLSEHEHEVTLAESGEQAIELLDQARPDAVILDLMLPGISGLELLTRIKARNPSTVCILITAFGSIRSAVDAIRAGGDDYVTKPFDNDELLLTIDRALEVRRLSHEVEQLRNELDARYGFNEIVGICPAMREVFRLMVRISADDAPVLILGESGTGKELVARAIHRRSGRKNGPFVAVNCSAIPSTLVEAEFFGAERGAYTDAKETRIGRFEQAHGGTLFLDEVGDLPIDAQAKLLRVLQEREVTKLGGRRPIKVNVRVLAATHHDLELAVRKGRFREDLYWRLNVLGLKLPALRERTQDLPLLIDALLERFSQEVGLGVRSLSLEARRLLVAHDWPGNVRELENTLRRAMVVAEGDVITARDLPPRIRGEVRDGLASSERSERLTLIDAVANAVERVERYMIQASLDEHRGNRTAAAESLGINRKTLFNKMRSYAMAVDGDED